MTSYADTMRVMVFAYPSLFADEYDVLHHLFFVNGNGYEWEGGELVSGQSEEDELRIALAQHRNHVTDQIQILMLLLKKEAPGRDDPKHQLAVLSRAAYLRKQYENHQAQLKALDEGDLETYVRLARERDHKYRLDCIAEGVTDCWFFLPDGSIGRRLYPVCEYAKILHVPKDVKPDWLAAAKKALEWAMGPTCRTTKKDQEWLKKAAELLESR